MDLQSFFKRTTLEGEIYLPSITGGPIHRCRYRTGPTRTGGDGETLGSFGWRES